MPIPHKKFDLLLDSVIENEIQDWLEERADQGTTVEAEQILLIEEDFSPESGDSYSVR